VTATYHIPDEPRPIALSRFAVQPFWPLFGAMFGGSWLSWPWFVFNGFAIGSPTRNKELLLALVGFAGNFILKIGFGVLLTAELLPEVLAPYLYLVILVWRLAISYWLYVLQSQSFGIYEYYGGTVQNGVFILVLGYFVGRSLIPTVTNALPLLKLVI
jgi:hypothetical protein